MCLSEAGKVTFLILPSKLDSEFPEHREHFVIFSKSFLKEQMAAEMGLEPRFPQSV